ncbi:MAG: hypothetical protein RMM06_03465 [Armatimonadota bacterium]|nr:hypothetical protein [bacterium]MCS7308865.1 hypothetical protein [Armatimonadota bacterium]MDW8103395.1 hypothetical protein [Armatimonadota bacterium]MDW8289753.1 hypothetical protein [Armatimonadota bacterium]
MVFQDVIRSGGRTRSHAVARSRVTVGARWWCVLAAAGAIAYVGACGYLYSLSRERHQLLLQRDQLRKENLLLQSQCETLRNPLRIRQEAQAFGMVLLTKPQALAEKPVMLAQHR